MGGNMVVSDGLCQTAVTPFFFIAQRQYRPGCYRSGRRWYKEDPFRSRRIQQLFLKRKKREMLLLAPVSILWIQISRKFGVSLIAPRKFSTAESYLEATVGVGSSDWEQDVEKNIKIKMWEIEGVGEGDMERRKYTRRMKQTIIVERINIWSDFLCYFSLLFWTELNGQQIKHFPEFLLLQEGENFTTYCSSSSTF